MKWFIQEYKKKKGKYYILFSIDGYGLKRIWGRFKKYQDALEKAKKYMKKYGGEIVIWFTNLITSFGG